MHVALRTLSGDSLAVEVASESTIKAVKEMAAGSEHGRRGGWEVPGIKLIFQGKVLEDANDLASYGVLHVVDCWVTGWCADCAREGADRGHTEGVDYTLEH